MTNPRWMHAACGAIALGLGLFACADDSAMDASGDTSGTTTTGTGSESGGGSGKTDTTGDDVDPFEPWYGTWYWVDPRFTINETISTQNGAHGLGMNQVDFDDEEVELLTYKSGPLRRGELCLECPEGENIWGVVSDCGTPVPWTCPK